MLIWSREALVTSVENGDTSQLLLSARDKISTHGLFQPLSLTHSGCGEDEGGSILSTEYRSRLQEDVERCSQTVFLPVDAKFGSMRR